MTIMLSIKFVTKPIDQSNASSELFQFCWLLQEYFYLSEYLSEGYFALSKLSIKQPKVYNQTVDMIINARLNG